MTRNHVNIRGFVVSRIQDTAFADDLQLDAATDTQRHQITVLWGYSSPVLLRKFPQRADYERISLFHPIISMLSTS